MFCFVECATAAIKFMFMHISCASLSAAAHYLFPDILTVNPPYFSVHPNRVVTLIEQPSIKGTM